MIDRVHSNAKHAYGFTTLLYVYRLRYSIIMLSIQTLDKRNKTSWTAGDCQSTCAITEAG